MMAQPTSADLTYWTFVNSRLMGMRSNRYSWWTHWRELADYFLPRRYKWVITPNQASRGSPINQHIIDNTGTIAARNLAAGLMSGKSSPTRPWIKLRIDKIDSTMPGPVAWWLAECERLMYLVFAESNFYNSIAQFYYDLVIFGTGVLIIYEDFDNVINCYNPCAGEYYVDLDGSYRPCILYREFTMTIGAVADRFGIENCSEDVRKAFREGGTALTREIIVAHAIEPNDDKRGAGIDKSFPYREVYWQYGGTANPQSSGQVQPQWLEKKGYHEQPHVVVRWDIVSNDPYGRSPAMDGLGDQKQCQVETRRKLQAIDKMVNPPLVADIQLKNQPASLLPGGMTYIQGFSQTGKPAIGSIYDTKFPVQEITTDIAMVQERLKKVFFNDLFQTITQYQTRSNVTATEIDARRAEAMIMIGPVLERIDNEGLKPIIERVFAMMSRAKIFPEAPPEVQGKSIDIEFVSMLARAQSAADAGGIERVLAMAAQLIPIYPEVKHKIDTNYTLDKYSALLNNDPRMMRSTEEAEGLAAQEAQQMAAAAQAQQAEQLAKGANLLADTPVQGGRATALDALMSG